MMIDANQLHQWIVEQAVELVIVTDLDGVIVYANEQLQKSMGYSPGEVIGKKPNFFGFEQHELDSYEDLWSTITSGEKWVGSFTNRHKDGRLIYMDATIFPVRDGAGSVVGYASIQRDSATRIQTEIQLEKQLAESRELLSISQMLAGTIDLKPTLQQIARAASTLIKNSSRTILHLLDDTGNYLQAVAVSGDTGPTVGRRMNFKLGEGVAGLALQTGKTINIADVLLDERYIVPNYVEGRPRSLMVAPVRTGRKSLGTLSVQSTQPGAFTIDEERLLTILGAHAALAIEKAQLLSDLQVSLEHEKAARAVLVQSEKLAALGRIVASVAHELNNPMQAIQNALYLIQMDDGISRQAHEDVAAAIKEVERMSDLIARLKETYRPAIKEEFQIGSINQLVGEVQRLLTTHLRHNQVSFEFLPDESLPDIPMIRDQIKQVILNVSLNSVEAMPEGGKLIIRTRVDLGSESAVLSVSDTGPGINRKMLPYIFDPFITTKESGTGLGLAISYDIIRRHNGRIEVDSTPGTGTTFHIWLPLRQNFDARAVESSS